MSSAGRAGNRANDEGWPINQGGSLDKDRNVGMRAWMKTDGEAKKLRRLLGVPIDG